MQSAEEVLQNERIVERTERARQLVRGAARLGSEGCGPLALTALRRRTGTRTALQPAYLPTCFAYMPTQV